MSTDENSVKTERIYNYYAGDAVTETETKEISKNKKNSKVTFISVKQEFKEISTHLITKINSATIPKTDAKYQNLIDANVDLSNSIRSSLQHAVDKILVESNQIKKESVRHLDVLAEISKKTSLLESELDKLAGICDTLYVHATCFSDVNREYCKKFLSKQANESI